MKGSRVFVRLGILLLSALPLYAAEQAILPQVGNGTYAGGSMRTSFIFFNPTNDAITFTLRLTNDAGQPMLVTISSVGTTDEFGPFTVQRGGIRVLQTDGSGPLAAGSAVVDSSGPIGVSAVFSLYDGQQAFVTEAGVGASELNTDFVIPVDAQGGFNTGVALLNPGTVDAAVTYRLFNTAGEVVDTFTANLNRGQHLARFVAGAGELFPTVANFQGSLEVTSSQPLAALTLRQNAAPLSFTTLPVALKSSAQTSFNLPQVANGADAGTAVNMRTTFVLFNIAQTPATVTFNVRRPNGTAFPLTLLGQGPNTGTFSQSIPAGGATFLQTDGSGPLSVGSAQVTSDVPIGVSAIFTLYNGTSFLTEAGVGDSVVRTSFTLPVVNEATFSTGVAFFNPGTAPVSLTLRLLDAAGNRLGETAPLQLGAKAQLARFVSELFPGQTRLQGSLAIQSSGQIAAVTLRQNYPPLTYTTLPVVQGTSNGTLPPGTLLVEQTRTGVNASGNATLDTQLQPGFKITGSLSGRIAQADHIYVKDAAGNQFSGGIDHQTGKFVIAVPPGTYNLYLCYVPSKTNAVGLPTVRFADSNPITVTFDTVRDVPVPDVALRAVQGTVAGLAGLPTNNGVAVAFEQTDGVTSVLLPLAADGSYTGLLPDGSYVVSLVTQLVADPPQPALTIYSLSSITVSGRGVTAGFSLPARSVVSGKVRMADLSPAVVNTVITATDKAAATAVFYDCNPQAFKSSASLAGTGRYQMVLANEKSYGLSVAIPFGTSGTVFYDPGRSISSLAADRVEDFLVPAFPVAVTVSGKVTNPAGLGLAGITVIANSEQISGASSLACSSTATTDDAGNYTLTVLQGTDYSLRFVPASSTPAQ